MRVCFVCLGNICRSPTAEGVMRSASRCSGVSLVIDSAGTSGYHVGEPPDPRATEAAKRRGIELDHRARKFTRADLDRFDLVLAMDRSNLAALQRLVGARTTPTVRLLRSFDPTAPAGAEVPDPYYAGAAGFEEVLDQCERACAGLLDYVTSSAR
jgi:protein-tyrosine phosphatase